MSMYMYFEVGTTHFYHLALFNLVLGLTSIFIEIQEVQMMNGIYGDMTLYGYATILEGQQVHI